VSNKEATPRLTVKSEDSQLEFAQCFLRLANLPNFALDRLSRYDYSTEYRQLRTRLILSS